MPTFNGTNLSDTIYGTPDADNMIGGLSNDTYSVNNSGDKIIEYANQGIDIVYSSISYALHDNVEYLGLSGSNNLVGTGNDLNNVIVGNSGNSTLIGGLGNDTLYANTGLVTLIGDKGDDFYVVYHQNDIINENPGEGSDGITAYVSYTIPENVEYIWLGGATNIDGTGNNSDNYLRGNAGNNILTGNLGNDIMDGLGGNDTLIGGIGNDTYIFDKGYGINTIIDSNGKNTLQFGAGINLNNLKILHTGNDLTLSFVDSSDQINISNWFSENKNNISNFIFSNGINLTNNDINNMVSQILGLNSPKGSIDTLIGGLGNDIYYIDNTLDKIVESSNGGSETVYSSVCYKLASNIENLILTGYDNTTVTGNELNNYLEGNDGNNILNGASGNDTILGGIGIDTIYGGYGNDVFYVDNSRDSINENSNQGTDIAYSSVSYILSGNIEKLILTGKDNINGTGNALSNYIAGNDGNNILSGGAGNDSIIGGSGADSMYGGTGSDIYYVDNPGDTIIENTGQGKDTVYAYGSYTLPENVEVLYTQLGAIGNGNNLNNSIFGDCFNNNLSGAAGNDTIYGSIGDDTLDGGADIDILYGGPGNDIFYVDNPGDRVIEYAQHGIDSVYSSITNALSNSVENLILTGTDNLNGTGNGLNNYITGNNGNNILKGGAGNDILDGGSGNDTLIGDTGNDLHLGGLDNDVYSGYNIKNFGFDIINDIGGTADYLNLSNYKSSKLVITAVDTDNNTFVDALKLNFGSGNNVLIQNYFDNTSTNSHISNPGNGLIETIHFSNIDLYFANIQGMLP